MRFCRRAMEPTGFAPRPSIYPNDERIVREMGSKRVMLKNVQEAKLKKDPHAHRLAGACSGEIRAM